ncbi:hypothetical protein INT47_013265 [Mucor saturninus]|uniref:Uncharacterized protein n=1 Tax=Mucor saturninus TaxID=64648 RepID=A0A8H7QHE3_9FUNG|nr:hypothetical protein INT47_013265 [Mucor saturninus]
MYGLFAASFKVKEGLSDKAADTLLQFMNIALKDANDSSQPAFANVVQNTDIWFAENAIKSMHIKIKHPPNNYVLLSRWMVIIFKPKFVYPYKSLKSSLQELMLRTEFKSAINHWRLRDVFPRTYYDICDGKMFKTLIDSTGLPFLTLRNPLYATLNVDWFRPFDNVNYSCGAIYMCINNWKREDRFKVENIILVGLMPAGKEPKLDRINTYLKPLVDEILKLEHVVIMKTGTKPYGIKIHCVLLMLVCDIPDCRKVAGSAAHSSSHACNKYEGKFSLVDGKQLGSDLRWRNATTEKERDDLVKIWKEEEYFTKVNLEKMQVLAHSVQLFAGFESVDQKIASGFTNFKGDNWKSWCLLYSPFVLTGILPKENMRNSMDFVNTCRCILKTGIQQSEVDKAHVLFLDFNRVAEGLYRNKWLAKNQHLHGHLKQTIKDFSAPHAYWLFSFERCHGNCQERGGARAEQNDY